VSERSLRVLMTADTVGGVWSYAWELIRALAAFDVDVTLATMGDRLNPTQARSIAQLANVTVSESNYALEWMQDPWRDVDAAGEWLQELAQRTSPDVVHINGYAHAALRFEAPVIAVAHSCVCTWHRAVHGSEAGPEWNTYRRRVARGLDAARAVVAPTQAILQAILAAHRIDRSGRVIGNACDATRWPRADKEPFILGAGRLWDRAKGLAELDACAPRTKWPIYVAGATRAPNDDRDVEARTVNVLGELSPDALAGWMSRASIYALPARYEPFGLSAVEAALAGCALVLGDIASLREVWLDAALYVRPGDPGALAAVLDSLAADPLRRRALAASARKRALDFTPARMAQQYHALYCELAGRTQEECA
jgi:glycogen(starch) synthase